MFLTDVLAAGEQGVWPWSTPLYFVRSDLSTQAFPWKITLKMISPSGKWSSAPSMPSGESLEPVSIFSGVHNSHVTCPDVDLGVGKCTHSKY